MRIGVPPVDAQMLTGGCGRRWFIPGGRPPHVSWIAWRVLTEATRQRHIRWLQLIRSMPAQTREVSLASGHPAIADRHGEVEALGMEHVPEELRRCCGGAREPSPVHVPEGANQHTWRQHLPRRLQVRLPQSADRVNENSPAHVGGTIQANPPSVQRSGKSTDASVGMVHRCTDRGPSQAACPGRPIWNPGRGDVPNLDLIQSRQGGELSRNLCRELGSPIQGSSRVVTTCSKIIKGRPDLQYLNSSTPITLNERKWAGVESDTEGQPLASAQQRSAAHDVIRTLSGHTQEKTLQRYLRTTAISSGDLALGKQIGVNFH